MDSFAHTLGSQALGETLPPNDIHAVSVSLPTWAATLGWATRDEVMLKRMRTGYPRFFIHKYIETLAWRICEKLKHESPQTMLAIIFPLKLLALQCERYLNHHAAETPTMGMRTVSLALSTLVAARQTPRIHWEHAELHAVLYPSDLYPVAKGFWQHTGFGISSRYAEFCLGRIDDLQLQTSAMLFKPGHAHTALPRWEVPAKDDEVERAGISPQGTEDKGVKSMIRRHIAKLASGGQDAIEEKDVYLFPSGMSAISTIAQALHAIKESEASLNVVAYGFLYLDTFKTLSKIYAFDTTLYGAGSTAELDEFESRLKLGYRITSLFCEFPGNPLLRTPDLRRLRTLADEYDFTIVCDDTVGTLVNVDVLSQVDILCTSLTKIFSGACNVMGGSVVLNPLSRRYIELKSALSANFIDTYFPADAAIMEANSREFTERVKQANASAEMVCTLLKRHHSVTKVYYPKDSSTQALYDAFKRPQGGYGYLLSVIFKNQESAVAFFDALDIAKGPSLGTNFTLACPYTLFAHYGEREWAAEYEVVEDLVRISVGTEEFPVLARKIEVALKAVDRLTLSDASGSYDVIRY